MDPNSTGFFILLIDFFNRKKIEIIYIFILFIQFFFQLIKIALCYVLSKILIYLCRYLYIYRLYIIDGKIINANYILPSVH